MRKQPQYRMQFCNVLCIFSSVGKKWQRQIVIQSSRVGGTMPDVTKIAKLKQWKGEEIYSEIGQTGIILLESD